MRADTEGPTPMLQGPQNPSSGAARPLPGAPIDIKRGRRGRAGGSDLSGHILGEIGGVRTEVQIKAHAGFTPEAIHPRDTRDWASEGERTPVMAKPAAWTERGDMPCVVQPDDWTTELREAHWDVRSDQEAEALCAGCPVRSECLADALREERGLDHRSRFLVRGGLTPKGRWSLESSPE